jgi:hypothetical protein
LAPQPAQLSDCGEWSLHSMAGHIGTTTYLLL